ncbi:MAG: hypothetical protein ACE14T_08855 [Syntrophales bacterium]
MKITPVATPQKPLHPKQDIKTGNPNNSFDAVLRESMDNASSPAANRQIVLSPVQPMHDVKCRYADTTFRDQVLQEIEGLLDIMDDYRMNMEDPRATLKEAYPFIERMKDETERLKPLLESLPEGDGARELLNRALVASTVEIIKFNRGEYLK